jgi:Peptidase of plants and bacteria
MFTPLLLCFVTLTAAPPSAEAPGAVRVTVDTSAVPDLAKWGAKSKRLVEKWHPRIAAMLPSDGFTPTNHVHIIFKEMDGVAYASGKTITIAAKWVRDHPDDEGMVVHELTHVIQSYPDGGPGWLVEGIADYVRFIHFEPKTKIEIGEKASYRDSYRTSAKFLAWIEKKHDKEFIRRINADLRCGKYDAKIFKARTGKTVDELWTEFVAAEKKHK